MPGRPWLIAGLVAAVAAPVTGPGGTLFGTTLKLAPVGASFISADRGYLMGDYACHGEPAGSSPCLALARTEDGGTSWQLLPVPPVEVLWGLAPGSSSRSTSVSTIDFANHDDGYLYAPGLEMTRNGGKSWWEVTLGQVAELTIAGDRAYALTTSSNHAGAKRTMLWQAQLGSDAWTRAALPVPTGSYDMVGGKDELLLLQRSPDGALSSLGPAGRIWVRKNTGGGWKGVQVPCQPKQDGAAASLGVSVHVPAHWAVDCELDNQSSQAMDVQHRVFITNNAGQTWSRAGVPPHQGTDVALAWNGANDFLLATASALDEVDSSVDGGRRWHTSIADSGDFYGWGNLSFVNTTTATVVGPTHNGYTGHPDQLYRTTDGGARWSVIKMPDIDSSMVGAL